MLDAIATDELQSHDPHADHTQACGPLSPCAVFSSPALIQCGPDHWAAWGVQGWDGEDSHQRHTVLGRCCHAEGSTSSRWLAGKDSTASHTRAWESPDGGRQEEHSKRVWPKQRPGGRCFSNWEGVNSLAGSEKQAK